MSTNNNATTNQPISIHQMSGIYETQRPRSSSLLYNADLFEDLEDGRFDHLETRRLAKARHCKATRRLAKADSEDWN